MTRLDYKMNETNTVKFGDLPVGSFFVLLDSDNCGDSIFMKTGEKGILKNDWCAMWVLPDKSADKISDNPFCRPGVGCIFGPQDLVISVGVKFEVRRVREIVEEIIIDRCI